MYLYYKPVVSNETRTLIHTLRRSASSSPLVTGSLLSPVCAAGLPTAVPTVLPPLPPLLLLAWVTAVVPHRHPSMMRAIASFFCGGRGEMV